MAQMLFDPKQFTASKAKPLPVILMLDTSDTMNWVINPEAVTHTGQFTMSEGHRVELVEGGITRITVLNDAVKKMIRTFAKYEHDATEILVSIITFGKETRLFLPPSAASDVRFVELEAGGEKTPLADALRIAKQLIENKTQIPSRAYRPLVVLVSDGMADDGWQERLDDFVKNGRTMKCDRMALAISKDADRDMLSRFVAGTEHTVFESDSAEKITEFFRFVTMSTVQRTLAQNPNIPPKDSAVEVPPPPATENNLKKQDTNQQEKTESQDEEEGYW